MSNTPAISDEKYVSFTTYKKDGSPRETPVWIADLGDGTVGFTTNGGSWKAKRIRDDSRVALQASNSRGVVEDGADTVEGTAELVTGSDFDRVKAAIKAKYGWQVTMVKGVNTVRSWFGKDHASDTGVVVTLADAGPGDDG
jgi:PPOX class probable F420-dependent enzyme